VSVWWVISEESIREMLSRSAAGEDPDMIYTEFYANSEVEHPEERDIRDADL
jgi:hypothetical protein